MKKILFFLLLLSKLTFGAGYGISEEEITKNIKMVNSILFDEEDAEHFNKLVAGTISVETLYGNYKGSGKFGISQITPTGWSFIQSRIQKEDIGLIKEIGYENDKVKFKELKEDHLLAIIYCSLYYKYKLNGNVPQNLEECAKVWKKHYNTPEGAGTVEDFKRKYIAYGKKYLAKN